MIAVPWHLLAGGIVLIIIGYFIIGLGPRGSGGVFIHPDMDDQEIAQEMNKAQGSPVSIVWRLVRFFV